MTDPSTVGQLLETRLRQLGVMRVYGNPLGGLDHVAVRDPDLAVLLADADGRLGHRDSSGRLGAALIDGPILHLSSQPGGVASPRRVADATEVVEALTEPPGIEVPGTFALHLDLDLDQPVGPAELDHAPTRPPVLTLDPAMSPLRIVLLVGPGVVRAARVDELRELARRGGWGIVNTWGARGVERWDSPFNFATVGLQARDLEFGGIIDADVVVASGVDPDELPADVFDPDGMLGSKLVQHVPPRQLAALLTGWAANRQLPQRAPHHERLGTVLTPLYESDAVPLTGPRAALHLSGALPEGGVVVADAGHAGFWLARSFPTATPGSLCVPATHTPGFAAAAALVCALEGRPCIAVTDQSPDGTDSDPIEPVTAAVAELAEAMGAAIAIQLWGTSGSMAASSQHVDLTTSMFDASGVNLVDVPVSTSDTTAVEAVLGGITAWDGQP